MDGPWKGEFDMFRKSYMWCVLTHNLNIVVAKLGLWSKWLRLCQFRCRHKCKLKVSYRPYSIIQDRLRGQQVDEIFVICEKCGKTLLRTEIGGTVYKINPLSWLIDRGG